MYNVSDKIRLFEERGRAIARIIAMTLVVLAAGMGSRYGGLKQIDPMTPHGEFIIDFSIYDAIRAGFDRVVFIIKEENYDVFRETIGDRIAGKIRVEYAFQALDKLVPADKIPPERTKPWGTYHAIMCAKDLLNDPFAVINADDFYGADAYAKVAEFLRGVENKPGNTSYAMVGYQIGKTLTDAGSVARGVCITENGKLQSIVERTKIFKDPNGARFEDENGETVILPNNSPVSMNFWGFTPEIFRDADVYFTEFLADPDREPLKSECYLPNVGGQLVNDKKCEVTVLETSAQWYGVTYQDDKANVIAQIRSMVEKNEYPDGLWK